MKETPSKGKSITADTNNNGSPGDFAASLLVQARRALVCSSDAGDRVDDVAEVDVADNVEAHGFAHYADNYCCQNRDDQADD